MKGGMSRPAGQDQAASRAAAQRRTCGAPSWLFILATLLLPLTWAAVAHAQAVMALTVVNDAPTATTQVAPVHNAAGNLVRQGYRLEIYDQWPSHGAYRYVRFALQANPPLPEDATVTIRYQGFNYDAQPHAQVEQDFELPAGKAGLTEFAMSVPNHSFISHSRAQVWINGVPQSSLDTIVHNNGNGGQDPIQVLDVTPARDMATSRLPVDSSHQLNRTYMSPGALSPSWIDYTAVDVVCIRRGQLQELIKEQPRVWQAIRHWVSAGGNLWIDEMGDHRQTWPEVAQWLGLPADGLVDQGLSPQATWQALKASAEFDGLRDWFDEVLRLSIRAGNRTNNLGLGQIAGHVITLQGPDGQWMVEEAPPETPPDDEMFDELYGDDANLPSWALKEKQEEARLLRQLTRQVEGIRECSWGLGHVVLFAGPWNESMTVFSGADLVPDFASYPRMHFRINGDILRHGYRDFWDWVIPGVGRPPVVLFQVLISLFVVAIGPLNYFMLRRKGRLHLLVVTVPLSAALVTGGLIGYAALAEGFETYARVRSFTYLDQTRGEAACWSRQTYYAGVAPADGLRFPTDVAVYRYPSSWEDTDNVLLETEWNRDQQLTRGWIQSRTLAQFMCLRSRATTAALEVDSQAGAPPRVTNRLGTNVRALLLTDGDGKTYGGLNLAENDQAELQTNQLVEAASAIYDMIQNNPLGDRPAGGRVTAINMYDRDFLEWLIHQVAESAAVTGGQNQNLPPRTYLALVEASPEVPLGCEAKQVNSLNLVWGRW